MQKFVTFLRGINVSGKKLIAMEDLRTLYGELGFTNVESYIQSGNIAFESEEFDPQIVTQMISDKITEKYKFTVPIIVRNAAEIKAVVTENPFLKQMYIEKDRLHVTFLAETPAPEHVAKLSDQKFHPEKFIVLGKEVFLYCPHGYGNTKINNNYFESKLKVSATTRNWRTINKLAEMLDVSAE